MAKFPVSNSYSQDAISNGVPPPTPILPVPDSTTPDVLQWNCRSLQMCTAELNELFRTVGCPALLLLQETRGESPGIRGYSGYFQPSIQHKLPGQDAHHVQAQCAVFVRNDIVHTRIDTSAFCDSLQEVVAVRCLIPSRSRPLVAVSYYARPATSSYRQGRRPSQQQQQEYLWIRRLQTAHPGDDFLISGDFNAQHPAWGYNTENGRGTALFEMMASCGMELANDLDYPTRYGLHGGQRCTTPDLTWTSSRSLVREWRTNLDPLGSDHYPIWIELTPNGRKRDLRRRTRSVDWDKFRTLLRQYEDNRPVSEVLQKAVGLATRTLVIDPELPTPDKHLANLWAARKRLQSIFVRNGKRHADLIRLRRKTAEARRYAKHLARDRWQDHCASFGEKTGARRLWQTFRSMCGKSKSKNTGPNLRLKLDMDPAAYEQSLATTLFPEATYDSDEGEESIYDPLPVVSEEGSDSLFTIAELAAALESVNARSAPGKDGITWVMLRNLDEQQKEKLLHELNTVWTSCHLPDNWRHSVVHAIPKPGKPTDRLSNLRPISLTSTLCKLLERMVLSRLNHHLEYVKPDFFDPGQTGFRKGLCTYDSIHLIKAAFKRRYGRLRQVPGLLVAVDLQRAFDTVRHDYLLEALAETDASPRIQNFVRAFLRRRTFEFASSTTGVTSPKVFHAAGVGVPQGAIISPTLFNIAMAKTARALRKIPGLGSTAYADDVTIWAIPQQCTTTEATVTAVQKGLDTLSEHLQPTGMQVSPTKTQYLIIRGSEYERAQVHLTLNGNAISQPPDGWTRILGIPFHENGTPNEWLSQLRKSWKSILHVVQRIGSRFGGACTEVLRTLVTTVLTAKACYGAMAIDLTKAQMLKLEVLHRESLRVVTGLPRHAKVEDLHRYARLPSLEATLAARRDSNASRRTLTNAGRRIIRLADEWVSPELPPLPLMVPPWEDTLVTRPKPLPRRRNKERHTKEREARARSTNDPKLQATTVYTDAAWNEEAREAKLAVVTPFGSYRGSQTYKYHEPTSTQLELHALWMATLVVRTEAARSLWTARQNVSIMCDNTEAIKRLQGPCIDGSVCHLIKRECKALQTNHNIQVRIDWVPGHAGSLGNEAAHAMASAQTSPLHSLPDHPVPPLIDVDPASLIEHEKNRRRKNLRDMTPQNEHPLPKGLPRGAQVLTYKARTGAALTEDVLHKWRSYVKVAARNAPERRDGSAALIDPPYPCPYCKDSTVKQDIRHLLWDCGGLRQLRARHAQVPSYEEWTTPTNPGHAKETLLSLWEFAKESGVARRI